MKRAAYDKQYKMAAVKHAQSVSRPIKDVARELDISGTTLRRWINEYDEYGESAFPGHGNALFNSTYEIKKLQKQVEELKLENEILKKTPGLLEAKECVRFQFLKENQRKYNIKKACKILKISRSGYYEFLHRKKSKRAIENEALTEMIEDIFQENHSRYGARRIQLVLEKQGIQVNSKRVSRLMSEHGLVAKGTRKAYRRPRKGKAYEEQEDVLNRVFSADERNKIWVGDITYIPTKHGFLYLAVFIDIYSRKVTGWAMDTRIRDTLVLAALNQAIGREHPEAGLLVHTDRGAQYTSQRFQALLARYGFQQSMSRKGNPYDNAIMESFYRTLKRELVQDAGYDNPEQARQEIFQYIELYYNTKRIHSALGWLSPTQFEAQNT